MVQGWRVMSEGAWNDPAVRRAVRETVAADGDWEKGANVYTQSQWDALVAERDRAVKKLDEIGSFAASHSGYDGQGVLLAALYRIAEEAEGFTRAALVGDDA
jgi:hypothetical protein